MPVLERGFGDNFLMDERFTGQQLPLDLKVESRHYSLLPRAFPVAVYGNAYLEQLRILEWLPTDRYLQDSQLQPSLGSGMWRRVGIDLVTPLITDGPLQVSQFADFEARFIDHNRLSEPRSAMRSWRTGLELRLPIDGKGPLPKTFQDEVEVATNGQATDRLLASGEPQSRRFVHHLMDYRLRYSVRPSVVKRGPYTRTHLPWKVA